MNAPINNGKIDKNGALHIERAGKMLPMYCPLTKENCSHWCPHFGNPEKSYPPIETYVSICQGKVLSFMTFTDERTISGNSAA